jgi:DNA-binding NtrC family response regulator
MTDDAQPDRRRGPGRTASLGPRSGSAAPLVMAVGADPETCGLLRGLAGELGCRFRSFASFADVSREASFTPQSQPELLFLLDVDAAAGLERLQAAAREVIVVVDPDQLPPPGTPRPADLLCRPLDPRFVRQLLQDLAAEFQRRSDYADDLHVPPMERFGGLQGSAPVMRQLFMHMRRIARSGASVLVYGERGTGKTLAARALHQASRCAAGPFVVVDGRDVDHQENSPRAGTRTSDSRANFWAERFEAARGGTLFVNHLNELPLQAQIPLLRALENPAILGGGGHPGGWRPVRVIAAVDRDPLAAIRGGKLRQDLYDRLADFVLRLPPLRERRNDLAGLARLFLRELNARSGTAKVLTREASEAMSRHAWPGNVSELKNVMEHAHAIAGEAIGVGALPSAVCGGDAFANCEAGQLGDIV